MSDGPSEHLKIHINKIKKIIGKSFVLNFPII